MADYYRKKLPPEIQPMQTLPVKNYTPGVYGGFSHANPAEEQGLRNELGDQFAAEVRNTAIRRREAADIRSGNRAKAAAESARFNRPSNRPNVGRGRVKGMKLGRFKGRANAQLVAAFLDIIPGAPLNMASNRIVSGWKQLAQNPNAGRLSNREQSAYVSAKAGSTIGFESAGQMMERQRRLAKLGTKLNPMSRLSGRRRFSYQVARDRAERRRKWRA